MADTSQRSYLYDSECLSQKKTGSVIKQEICVFASSPNDFEIEVTEIMKFACHSYMWLIVAASNARGPAYYCILERTFTVIALA